MDDRIAWSIKSFVEEQWIEPAAHWPQCWFDRNSYSRWAGYEIVELLENRGDRSPIKIVEGFIGRMDRYSCKNTDTRKIFSIAREAGHDILDVLRAMGSK